MISEFPVQTGPFVIAVLILLFLLRPFAQTLFTVDGTPVSKEEFLKAFYKK